MAMTHLWSCRRRVDAMSRAIKSLGRSGGHGVDQLLQQYRSDLTVWRIQTVWHGRELGKHSLELYTQIKSVYVKL
jgi:hypothetical protein